MKRYTVILQTARRDHIVKSYPSRGFAEIIARRANENRDEWERAHVVYSVVSPLQALELRA